MTTSIVRLSVASSFQETQPLDNAYIRARATGIPVELKQAKTTPHLRHDAQRQQRQRQTTDEPATEHAFILPQRSVAVRLGSQRAWG
jgi:hypothetical protein